MESPSISARASFGWNLAIFVPLAAALGLQLLSQREIDLHARVRISITGNLFLSLSLIAQSLYLTRRTKAWGIVLLIFSATVLVFGLRALMRAL